MSATVSAYEAVMKEIWTQDQLERQFIAGHPVLEQIERTNKYMIGAKAVVPQHTGRSGGYTVLDADGGQLNNADRQKVARVEYELTHHYFQIQLESAAIDQTASNKLAAAAVLETEITGALDDLRNQVTRQIVSSGDGIIARCGTTSNSTEVELDPTHYGFGAIERGFLYPGLPVDIGTATSPTSIASGATITAVEDNPASPSITITGSAVSTSNTNFVSLKGARGSGGTTKEAHGLRQIAGSNTAPVGSLDPSTAPYWKPAAVDSTTTELSLGGMMTMSRKVKQKSRDDVDWVLTSLLQQQRFYELLQTQTRFAGDSSLGGGNVGGVRYAGMKVDGVPEIFDSDMFFLKKKHLFILGEKPYWQNRYTGGKILEWRQGYSSFVATLMYRFQLATNRRNVFAAYTALQ